MRKIEFISYDGKYPNLCRGTLVLRIDGEYQKFTYRLQSGGDATLDPIRGYSINKGPWKITNDAEVDSGVIFTAEEVVFVERLLNQHIPCGCCGGCL